MLKDHYQILNISPTASAEEVKKSFRRLALKYHPDKNQGNSRVSTVQFEAIKEAYDVLIDPIKRQQYNYQFYAQLNRSGFANPLFSADEVLYKAIDLQNKLAISDPFRIDVHAVHYQIIFLLSDHNIQLLKTGSNSESMPIFITAVLQSSKHLPYSSMKDIGAQLLLIDHNNTLHADMIKGFLNEQQWVYYWYRYKILIALLIALLVCVCIYLLGKKP